MTLRAALIGCGGLGKVHAQMVQPLEGMKMVAFCDVDGARAEQLCREFQGDYATSDVERIFSDPTIQVVYICTHHDTHAPFCLRAARADKHIMVEKPLALTTEECVEIGRVVEATGTKLMTAFKMRYF
ncbi:MAG: Gfo/Idh/MocA family oxidoreductase, partial [Chloroflexi bacterium]|nr:Gfo/Idh/MocA family oxidoreductase [Chloroflexota bacterium]